MCFYHPRKCVFTKKRFFITLSASTPPTALPASTIENIKDWLDLRNEVNGNNTIINGQSHPNSIHVSDKSMLIIFSSWNWVLELRECWLFNHHFQQISSTHQTWTRSIDLSRSSRRDRIGRRKTALAILVSFTPTQQKNSN